MRRDDAPSGDRGTVGDTTLTAAPHGAEVVSTVGPVDQPGGGEIMVRRYRHRADAPVARVARHDASHVRMGLPAMSAARLLALSL